MSDSIEDLKDAIKAIERAIELVEEFSQLWHYVEGLNKAKRILKALLDESIKSVDSE